MVRILFLLPLLLMCCTTHEKPEEVNQQQLIEPSVKTTDNNKEVVCFVYHRFNDDRYPSTNISTKDFENHLQYLKDNDFQVLTFSDAINYLQSSGDTQKTVVITIDDGFSSFYKNGLPILKKFDYPATLFINTETVDSNDYMNWDEVNDAKRNHIEIGNHTHSHDYFLNLPENERYERFEQELVLSQKLIKDQLNIAPTVFAYPYGELDTRMKQIVKRTGFKAAAAQNSGVIYYNTDLLQCPRFPMAQQYAGLSEFASKANMKALKVKDVNPQSYLHTDNSNAPELTLKFKKHNLKVDQLQCFVQGSKCKQVLKTFQNGDYQLSLKAETPIDQRRRTLYTVTIPDEAGNWHWFSHLWINPEVKH